jgi:hypothetical protein
MVLRGAPDAFPDPDVVGLEVAEEEKGFVVDVLCAECTNPATTPNVASGEFTGMMDVVGNGHDLDKVLDVVVVPSRKRAKGRRDKVVKCDVCREYLGTGGVKISKKASSVASPAVSNAPKASGSKRPSKKVKTCDSSSVSSFHNDDHDDEDAFDADAQNDTGLLVANFSVEVVCTFCREHFAFCSDCGGGGKHRTGKYRPVEYFAEGRKTCRLSHVRVGEKVSETGEEEGGFRCEVLEMANGMRNALKSEEMRELKTTLEDGLLSFVGNPRVLRGSSEEGEEDTGKPTGCGGFEGIQGMVEECWDGVEGSVANQGNGERMFVVRGFIPKVPRKKRSRNSTVVKTESSTSEVSKAKPVQEHHIAFLFASFNETAKVVEMKAWGVKMLSMQSAILLKHLVSKLVSQIREVDDCKGVEMKVRRTEGKLQSLLEKVGFNSGDGNSEGEWEVLRGEF